MEDASNHRSTDAAVAQTNLQWEQGTTLIGLSLGEVGGYQLSGEGKHGGLGGESTPRHTSRVTCMHLRGQLARPATGGYRRYQADIIGLQAMIGRVRRWTVHWLGGGGKFWFSKSKKKKWPKKEVLGKSTSV